MGRKHKRVPDYMEIKASFCPWLKLAGTDCVLSIQLINLDCHRYLCPASNISGKSRQVPARFHLMIVWISRTHIAAYEVRAVHFLRPYCFTMRVPAFP